VVINLLRRIFFVSRIQNFSGHSDNYENRKTRHEGDITVEKEDRSRKKKISKEIGEYVKYEEVDED